MHWIPHSRLAARDETLLAFHTAACRSLVRAERAPLRPGGHRLLGMVADPLLLAASDPACAHHIAEVLLL
ncbi:hypothetical protein ACU686_42090 [Yinghuangia aomiensis]